VVVVGLDRARVRFLLVLFVRGYRQGFRVLFFEHVHYSKVELHTDFEHSNKTENKSKDSRKKVDLMFYSRVAIILVLHECVGNQVSAVH
jgi:hypothetical protein